MPPSPQKEYHNAHVLTWPARPRRRGLVAAVGVPSGMVRAVTISPAGQVTGSPAGGHSFTTTIPVALGGNGLAGDLAAHHVQVTATTATSSSAAATSGSRP